MDKIAQLKSAEVAGVISGLIDGGYIKLASEQEFEALTDVVAGSISDNWDLNEVLDKTAEVMDYVAQEPIEKTAEEELHDVLADYGYLCLAKEAEEISDADFRKEAGIKMDKLMGAIKAMNPGPNAKKVLEAVKNYDYRGAGRNVWDAATARDLQSVLRGNKIAPGFYDKGDILSALKAPGKVYGALAGTGLAAYGVNKLRKKENRDAVKGQAMKAYGASKALTLDALNKLKKSKD